MSGVLVLAPHADDAEFGLGGYLHRRWRERLGESKVVVFAFGHYWRSDGQVVLDEDRRAEGRRAFAQLHVDSQEFRRVFAENRGDIVGLQPLADHVERAVDAAQPDEVFICLPSFNQDHGAQFDATIVAFRPGRLDGVAKLYAYEYPGNCWGPPAPRYGRCYVRLSDDDFLAKQRALLEHRTQFDDRHGHVGPEGAEALAALRGSEWGVRYAERFYLLRGIE
jgi:LmbE family N-acetylglucosaminyl deacetylase